jgi:hypothetical protein
MFRAGVVFGVEIEAELRSWRGKPLNRWQHKDKNHYNDT